MTRLDDPSLVAAEYADESRLLCRARGARRSSPGSGSSDFVAKRKAS
jgi:hypothetical protein